MNTPISEDENTYEKRYKMRGLGEDKLNTVVSIPRIVIEKEARKRGLSVEVFLERFVAVAVFNGFEGIFYRFEPVERNVKEH